MSTEHFAEQNPLAPSRHRRKRQNEKLEKHLVAALASVPGLRVVGPDPLIKMLMEEKLQPSPMLATCQVLLNTRPTTVVVIPTRLTGSKSHRTACRVAIKMAMLNRRCVLLPQSEIDGPPDKVSVRLAARLSVGCRNTAVLKFP